MLWATTYVRSVEAVNRRVGRFAMCLLFVIMANLVWSSFTKVFRVPSLWTLEMAQFTLVACEARLRVQATRCR